MVSKHIIIFRDNFESCNNWTAGSTTCQNNEATISSGGKITLNEMSFGRFKNYRIEFEVFSDQTNGINIGYAGSNSYYLRQSNTCDLYLAGGSSSIKTYSVSPFKNANTWYKARFEPQKIKIGDQTFDAPTGYSMTSFHFHKFDGGYLKVRNFRVSVLADNVCSANNYRNINNKLSLILLLVY